VTAQVSATIEYSSGTGLFGAVAAEDVGEHGDRLALARGDATALDEYNQHGRIRGAPPDYATDQAARAYVATYLTGRNVLLMAADWARCRELSARIRDDLIHLGLADGDRTIRIADGARASAGDLIICRANDHRLEAGEPGRALANGDILRIEAITRRGIMVRRLLDPTRPPASAGSPTGPSATPATRRPISPTRSPAIRPRAPPCTPASRWSPAARTGSGSTRP
jgi:hypothetical protein